MTFRILIQVFFCAFFPENCPIENEAQGQHSPHRHRQPHDSLEFLIKLTNATGCLGTAAKLRVFYVGNNFTVVKLHKVRLSANRSVSEHEMIDIDKRKFHVSWFYSNFKFFLIILLLVKCVFDHC